MSNTGKKYNAYVGTYTQNGGTGIYIYTLDASTGNLELTGISSQIINPSYFAVSTDRRFLYAVSETESTGGVGGGSVAAYMLEKHTGKLMFLNSVSTKGSLPCHISTDKANRYLFIANYEDGSFIVFNLNSDGSIGPAASYIRHHGSGMNPERQEKPHVHFTALTPDEKYLCAVDLGIDSVLLYGFDAGKHGILNHEKLSVPVKPGSGPRHIEFSTDGKFAWVINELSSNIISYSCNYAVPSFTEIQCISALPEGFTGTNYCSAIHSSLDGNFLYASNRGHDSIAVFEIDKNTGKLGHPHFSSSYGSWPRDFAIDPTGKYLFAANQNSGTIVPFALASDTGMLEPLGQETAVPCPVCIKFVELH